jgi:kexin
MSPGLQACRKEAIAANQCFEFILIDVFRWLCNAFPLSPLYLSTGQQMLLPFTLVLAVLASLSAIATTPTKRHYSTHDYYVLEHHPSAGASLEECVNALGVELVEQAGELQNHWIVRTEKRSTVELSPRGTIETDHILARFESLRSRAASHGDSYFFRRSTGAQKARRIVSSVKYLSRQIPRKRTKRDGSVIDRAPPPITATDESDNNTSSRAVALRMGITDPMFGKQWHLVNDDFPQHMMNATPVWAMGFTGKGVISALVDDGLDYQSDDLAANFVRIFLEFLITILIIDRMRLAPMISMTMSTCPLLCYSMIIMALAALAK